MDDGEPRVKKPKKESGTKEKREAAEAGGGDDENAEGAGSKRKRSWGKTQAGEAETVDEHAGNRPLEDFDIHEDTIAKLHVKGIKTLFPIQAATFAHAMAGKVRSKKEP